MELSLKNEQKQMLSPNMIQSLNILQMAAVQLDEYLNEKTLENPVMELSEKQPDQFTHGELEKYQWLFSRDKQSRYLHQRIDVSEEETPAWNMDMAGSESLSDYLWSQLLTQNHTAADERILHFFLDSLDARGYFTDSISEIARRFQCTELHVEDLLQRIKNLDPAGVGAGNLEECLCIQLHRMNQLTPELKNMIYHHLPAVAKNQISAIARNMNIPVETVKEYFSIIKALNPKPCALFSESHQICYITPDVVIVSFKDHFDILLNESLYPDIGFNVEYIRMSETLEDDEAKTYLIKKIHQTEWLKQCIAQRNTTLFSVVQTILSLQIDFFRFGVGHLRPLRLSDAALVLGIHESTVSRAIRQKYLQCSWGVYPLSYFFAKAAYGKGSESAPGTVSDVKQELTDIIEKENKKKPYSDQKLSELLTSRGFSVSRRTVAKYRDEEGMRSASGRKEY